MTADEIKDLKAGHRVRWRQRTARIITVDNGELIVRWEDDGSSSTLDANDGLAALERVKNPGAVALGVLAAGAPKRYSQAELKRRRARMKELNRRRKR